MKKLLITLFILSLLFVISGCKNENIQVQNEITPLSDEEVDRIYKKAFEVYSWFDIGTLGTDINQKKVVKDMTYFKVTGELTKHQELIDIMDSVFDDEIVESLLSRSMYINVDGELYGVLADRGTDIYKGAESYEIIRKSDKAIVYKVTVEVIDDQGKVTGHEIYDFDLLCYDDGKWRFKEFYMIR